MRIMNTPAALALLLLSIGHVRPAFAENPQFVLAFGGQPGLPLTHAYDYGLPATPDPVYTMRIPIVDKVINAVFHDTELRVLREGKMVDFIHAERAFTSIAECTAARDAIDKKLKELMPVNFTGGIPPWDRQTADGVTLGAAWCQVERQLPYPILHFEMTRAANAH